MADLFPDDVVRTVRAEAPRIARRFRVNEDDLAHRVIENFADHRRACARDACPTCEGQRQIRFVRGALKNESRDIVQERKTRDEREPRGAREELSDASDPARVAEEQEAEELLKFTASELAQLRARDRAWYDAFLLSSLGRSHREIAAILSLSEANSQQHVSRARKFLHDLRRKRLLTAVALGIGTLAIAVLGFDLMRARPASHPPLSAAPLRASPLAAAPLAATVLPGHELVAEKLVSMPLRGG